MKIIILAAFALLAMGGSGCVHSPIRGGPQAIDYDYDWRTEFTRVSPNFEAQPDAREALAAPGF